MIDEVQEPSTIEETIPEDGLNVHFRGGFEGTQDEEEVPQELLHGGEHFNDVLNASVLIEQMVDEDEHLLPSSDLLPREFIYNQITESDLRRPRRRGSY